MNFNFAIPALAAALLMSTAATATPEKKQDRRDRGSSTSVAGGAAGANRDGAVAGGVGASQGTVSRDQRRNQRNGVQAPNSAATSTSGAVFTTRRSGAAAVNTNGTATGAGSVRSSSQGDVFSSTNQNGSEADGFGNSDAEANEPKN